jgi:hypothetical protein
MAGHVEAVRWEMNQSMVIGSVQLEDEDGREGVEGEFPLIAMALVAFGDEGFRQK